MTWPHRDNRALQLSYEAGFDAMLACVNRRARIEYAITADSEFAAVVHRLACIRDFATLTAFGLTVEVGDRHRLTGRSIGTYVGLVPSEYSSGDGRTQGGVTKTGNGHVRRLLAEAAWRHRGQYRPGAQMRRRWDLASPAARARGQAENTRLHTRWSALDARNKRPVVANVAIAQELAGWCGVTASDTRLTHHTIVQMNNA